MNRDDLTTPDPPAAPPRLVSKDHVYVTVFGVLTLLGVAVSAVFCVIVARLHDDVPASTRDKLEALRLLSVALTAFLAAIYLALWLYRLTVLRRLGRLARGDYLVHWTYTRAEWDGYLEANVQNKSRRYAAAAWLTVFFGAAIGLGLGLGVIEKHGMASATILTAAGLTFGGALVGGVLGYLLMAWLRARARRSAQREHQQPVGDAYIGIGVLYCGGQSTTWGRLTKLQTLQRQQGTPDVLCFSFRTDAGNSTSYFDVLVPVPGDHADEADEVVRFFTSPGEEREKSRLYQERQERLTVGFRRNEPRTK